MKYDIYFHNDFDGRACAAVMLRFLRDHGDTIEKYVGMDYGKESDWYREDFLDKGNPAIVVDFTYHPKAAWWFDHHASTFKKPEWRKFFTPDKQHHLETQYPSCCGLVYAALKKDFKWKPPKHFALFVKSADMIDGARYRSARDTIEMKRPDIQMNSYIEAMPHSAKENKEMIEWMSEYPLETVIRKPNIVKAIKALKAKVEKSLAFYQKNLQVFEHTTFIDLTGDPLNALLRYAPYYLCPKSEFSIRMRTKGPLWYLGVAQNPWRKPKLDIDLGALMKTYRGGGHKGVGATEFRTKREALKAFEEINALLNSH